MTGYRLGYRDKQGLGNGKEFGVYAEKQVLLTASLAVGPVGWSTKQRVTDSKSPGLLSIPAHVVLQSGLSPFVRRRDAGTEPAVS